MIVKKKEQIQHRDKLVLYKHIVAIVSSNKKYYIRIKYVVKFVVYYIILY